MKRILIIAGLSALLAAGIPAGPAVSEPVQLPTTRMAGAGLSVATHYVQVMPGVWVAIKGSQERRAERYARFVASWTADQRAVAADNGYPSHRWLELSAGVRTEDWFYPDTNRLFVFDENGVLIDQYTR